MKKEPEGQDPVCKMEVKGECRIQATYKGREYYFCSEDCKKAFEIAPEKYVDQQKSG
jgi:YHS domain-containing protein